MIGYRADQCPCIHKTFLNVYIFPSRIGPLTDMYSKIRRFLLYICTFSKYSLKGMIFSKIYIYNRVIGPIQIFSSNMKKKNPGLFNRSMEIVFQKIQKWDN